MGEAKRRQILVHTQAFEAMEVVSRRGRLPSRVIFRIFWKPAIHPGNPNSNAAAPKKATRTNLNEKHLLQFLVFFVI